MDSERKPREGGKHPSSTRADDDAFVRLARSGETAEARALLSRHAGRLRGYLTAGPGAQLGGPRAVEALMSAAIDRALSRWKSYRPGRDGIALWLFTLGLDIAAERRGGRRRGAEREQVLAEFRRARDEPPAVLEPAPSRKPRWQPDELALLRKLYPRTPNLAIARALHRSVKSVVSKAHTLRLRKDPARLTEMGRQNVSRRGDRREREE